MEAGALATRDSFAGLLAARLTARVSLAGIVLASFAARAVASIGHMTPRYYPDEYIYSAIGRSLGTDGKPLVRGAPAHFPALLEPLLAAPLWAVAPLATAYRLVQLENVLFMSLAAIPVYLIARELRLTKRYSLLCALFAVALPDLVYSSFIIADPIAYPFVLAALYAGLVALTRGSNRAEICFLVLAGLSTAARVQYVVLFAAYAAASILLDRRRVLRAHPVFASAAGIAIAGLLAVGPSRLLGYYSAVLHLHLGVATLKWALADLFLLTLASGAVLVPGAVAGFLRPRGRAETAFSLLGVLFGAGILFEASLYASNGSVRFQERYLFMLMPLLPVAFGIHARRSGTGRLPRLLVAVAVVLALPLVPVSGYAAARGSTDSPFLFAFVRLANFLGAAGASIVIAAVATGALLLGLLPQLRRWPGAAVAIAVALVSVASAGATSHDLMSSRLVRNAYYAPNPAWIDAHGLHDVTAIQTPGAPPWLILNQLYWNRTVTREVLLGGAVPSDLFKTTPLRVARDGSLRTAGETVRSPILFQNYGVSATFSGASLVAREKTFTLWNPTSTPRLSVMVVGRYSDGWLAWSGAVAVWPGSVGAERGTLSFTLSLPRTARPLKIRFGSRRVRMRPGERLRMSFPVNGPRTITYGTSGGGFDANLRKLSVRSTMPVFTPAG